MKILFYRSTLYYLQLYLFLYVKTKGKLLNGKSMKIKGKYILETV